MHHPSFYHLTLAIFKEQCDTEHMMKETDTRREVKEAQRLKYRRRTQRLQALALHYE
jgi:hypothetical protein